MFTPSRRKCYGGHEQHAVAGMWDVAADRRGCPNQRTLSGMHLHREPALAGSKTQGDEMGGVEMHINVKLFTFGVKCF